MALRKNVASFPACPRCGAAARAAGARFCGQCGTRLFGSGSDMPAWQRPAAAKYQRVVMSRMALSCPECGEPMRYAFRKVCRRCGAKLIMIPRIMHPNHFRVFVPGLRAAAYGFTSLIVHFAVLLAVLVAIAGLVHALK